MAGKVGDVMMLRDGYGFGLHADRSAIPCLTLAFETQDEAAAARKVVTEVFAKAKRATAPFGRP